MRINRTSALVGRPRHWQHDSVIVRREEGWLNMDTFVGFDPDHDGAIRRIGMEAFSAITDFGFGSASCGWRRRVKIVDSRGHRLLEIHA